MEEILKFLKDCRTFYVATVDAEGKPHVRPFGAICAFEGKLYLVTNNTKKVYDQMMGNPAVEISGMAGGNWIRLEGTAKRDERMEAKTAMLEANPSLGRMYRADDGLMEVFALEQVTASICSFTGAPVVYNF